MTPPDRDDSVVSLLSAARSAVAAEEAVRRTDAQELCTQSSANALRSKEQLALAQQAADATPADPRLSKAVLQAHEAWCLLDSIANADARTLQTLQGDAAPSASAASNAAPAMPSLAELRTAERELRASNATGELHEQELRRAELAVQAAQLRERSAGAGSAAAVRMVAAGGRGSRTDMFPPKTSSWRRPSSRRKTQTTLPS